MDLSAALCQNVFESESELENAMENLFCIRTHGNELKSNQEHKSDPEVHKRSAQKQKIAGAGSGCPQYCLSGESHISAARVECLLALEGLYIASAVKKISCI